MDQDEIRNSQERVDRDGRDLSAFRRDIFAEMTPDESEAVKTQIRQKIKVWTTLGAVTKDGEHTVQSVLAGIRDGLSNRWRFNSSVAEEVYNENVRLGFVPGEPTDILPSGVDPAAYNAGREYAYEISLPKRLEAPKKASRQSRRGR